MLNRLLILPTIAAFEREARAELKSSALAATR
jgi:hypothetical protein